MMGKSSISMGNGFHGTRGYTKIYRLTTTRALNLGAENIGTRKKKKSKRNQKDLTFYNSWNSNSIKVALFN